MHTKLLQSCPTLCNPMDCSPPGSSGPWDSPGKNTCVDCHALLQGTFPTQGLNPCLLQLLHWQVDSLSLVPPGKAEWGVKRGGVLEMMEEEAKGVDLGGKCEPRSGSSPIPSAHPSQGPL